MAGLYPLLMFPHFDCRPWGTHDLAPIYDVRVDPGKEPIGEVPLEKPKHKPCVQQSRFVFPGFNPVHSAQTCAPQGA
jgi:hypothetical protein